MRPIKFRAWDKKENRMYAGSALLAINFSQNNIRVMTHPRPFQITETPFKQIELLESTGLTDKNGKEIYEGDIVACPPLFDGDKPYFEIFFGEHTLQGLKHWGWMSRSVVSTSLLDQSIVENCEVIGNIYENPELLTSSTESGGEG